MFPFEICCRADAKRSRTASHRHHPIPVDLVEAPKTFTVYADIPGVTKKDVDVHVQNEQINITVNRKGTDPIHNHKVESYHRQEREHGKVHRTVKLPAHADPNSASASFLNGVLTITFQKKAGSDKKIVIT